MQTKQEPLILTLRLDTVSQSFFDQLRSKHFPPERNFLRAHLTLFHQLDNSPDTVKYITDLQQSAFSMMVVGLRHLGAGVAYRLVSDELQQLHLQLSQHYSTALIPQDLQPFQPHITIQNKVTPEASKHLLAELRETFQPFTVNAIGLDLWEYLGGPWRHSCGWEFKTKL